MDPVAYAPLPSAPQPSAPPADSIVTVRPEILTIRLVSPASESVNANRKWFGYCCFIIIVMLFAIFAFYYTMFGVERKN